MYRDNELPAETTLETWTVRREDSAGWAIVASVVALCFGAAAFVVLKGGVAAETSARWKWPTIVGTLLSIVAVRILQMRRNRALVLSGQGDRHWLRVPREGVELELPLRMSGMYFAERMHGRGAGSTAMFHLYLKLSDEKGRGIVLHEIHATAQGAPSEWFEGEKKTKKKKKKDDTPSVDFETVSTGTCVRVRALIDELNAKTA